ncbi:MAG: hypothetical protein ABIX46_12880, partial [Burkholderiaceae bacterium]
MTDPDPIAAPGQAPTATAGAPADPPEPAPGQPPDAAEPALERFFERLDAAMAAQPAALRLALSKPRPGAGDLQRVDLRGVTLRGEAGYSLVEHHTTRDVTVNLSRPVALARVRALLGASFQHAHLRTQGTELALLVSRKGKATLHSRRVAAAGPAATPAATDGAPLPAATVPPAEAPHDRAKQRWVDIGRPFLVALGVTDAAHRLVPSMARKWKQINK